MLNKISNHEVDRRLVLKGAAAGGLGIAGATMLAGCASDVGPLSLSVRLSEVWCHLIAGLCDVGGN